MNQTVKLLEESKRLIRIHPVQRPGPEVPGADLPIFLPRKNCGGEFLWWQGIVPREHPQSLRYLRLFTSSVPQNRVKIGESFM